MSGMNCPPPFFTTPPDNLTEMEPASFPSHEFLPLKKPRISKDNPSDSIPHSISDPIAPCLDPANPILTSHVSFKTCLCKNFMRGTCLKGSNCSYAHGNHDMHKHAGNWKEVEASCVWNNFSADDQKIICREKLCISFCNGEKCLYGSLCKYLHEYPEKFRKDPSWFRESSAITIDTRGFPVDYASGSSQRVGNLIASHNIDTSPMGRKPFSLNTSISKDSGKTGDSLDGAKSHFTNLLAEDQSFGGQAKITRSPPIPSKPFPTCSHNTKPSNIAIGASYDQQTRTEKQILLNKKIGRKINLIYGDWIDDLRPLPKSPNKEN